MRLSDLHQPLYEGLDRKAKSTVMLWESAGRKIMEAELTADQINQLFTAVEKGATDAGGNRTMLGKGKDAAEAVNKAWEDLKSKIQDSGPIKDVDNAYDSAIAKIEAGLGGPDNAVNKVIQKYRKFAKEHPIAQGFIYSALIAAAGISGAGLGGAAVLGLLKMTDKLLQGDKFSSAVYKGAKTGAMAYGASKVGDMIKGAKAGDAAGGDTSAIDKGLADDQAFQDRLLDKYPPDQGYTFAAGEGGKSIQVLDATGNKVFSGDIPLKTMDTQTFADLTNAGKMATPGISSGSVPTDAMAGVSDAASNTDVANTAQQVAGGTVSNAMDKTQQAADVASNTDVSGAADAANNVDTSTATDTASNATPDAPQADTSTATDAAANASGGGIKAVFTDGNNGTLTDVDGDTVPMTAYPSGGMQPRMPYGAEKVEFDYNGKKLTAWIYGRKAYVPDFDATATESYVYAGTALSESQIDKLIFIASRLQLNEGPWDSVKQAAGNAVDWAKTKGHNLTTKITADKLKSAWKDAGSPTDSAAVTQALVGAGADEGVITQALQGMGVDTTANPATDAGDGRVEPTMDAPASATGAQAQDDKQEPTMADPTQDAQQGADQAQQQGNVDVAGLSKLLPSVGNNPTPFKAAVAAIKANKPLSPVMKAALGNAFIDMIALDPGQTGQAANILKKVSSQ